MNNGIQSHRWDHRDEIDVIRADIPLRLKKNEKKLEKIKSHIFFQMLLYPYMRKLQKERKELLSDPDFLWMLQQREEKEGNWRGWYDYLGFHLKWNEFFIEDEGKMGIPELDEEFRVDLLIPIREDFSKYDPFPKLNYKFIGLLLGIYLNTFLVMLGLCVVATILWS